MNPRDWSPDSLVEPSRGPGEGNGRPERLDPERVEERLEESYEEGRRDGYRKGIEEGRSQAIEEERERVGSALEALESVLEELEREKPRWFRAPEKNLYAVATAVARRVVERELRQDQDAVRDLVRRAAAQFPMAEPVTIRLNPHDLSVLTAAADEDELPVAGGREVRWVPDPGIGRGGCVVEGSERLVDGRVDKALERIYREMTDE